MAEQKLSQQFKTEAVKTIPALVAKFVQLSYRGTVVFIQFIKQMLVDALGK